VFVTKETPAFYNRARCTLSARLAKAVATYVVGRRIRHTEEIKETLKEGNGEERNRYSERRKIISLHKRQPHRVAAKKTSKDTFVQSVMFVPSSAVTSGFVSG
jgi:hypothetical protein